MVVQNGYMMYNDVPHEIININVAACHSMSHGVDIAEEKNMNLSYFAIVLCRF